MLHYTVQAGDTLSGIAARYGTTYQAIANANGIANPNLIYAGQTFAIPSGGSYTQWTPPHHTHTDSSGKTYGVSYGDPNYCGDGDGDGWDVNCQHADHVQSAVSHTAPTYNSSPSAMAPVQHSSSSGTSAPSGISIPGMPQGLANCIWYRESTNGTNPAANGNQFGIIPASGYNVAGDSVAQQEQVAGQIYASVGGQAWAADGCPGT